MFYFELSAFYAYLRNCDRLNKQQPLAAKL